MHLTRLKKLFVVFVLLTPVGAYAERCKQNSGQFTTYNDANCLEIKSGLLWGEPARFGTDYRGAEEFCATNYGAAGDQWRLPTLVELRRVSGTAANVNLGWSKTQKFLWTKANQGAERAALVLPSFDNALVSEEAYEDRSTFKASVVCVRNAYGCRVENGDFQSSNGGCHQGDSKSTWSELSRGAVLINDAAQYCKQLRQGGFNDWRVATSAQLLSLGRSGMTAVFGEQIDENFWTSEHRQFSERLDSPGLRTYLEQHEMLMINPKSGKSRWHISSAKIPDGEGLYNIPQPSTELGRVACVRSESAP